ncbi:hypothetical protein EDD18DRAFT_1118395 [Armillaria luteobubalina]|uniref:Uncharacterized protein n=1 Tax=Armillaria luteobubalina TaxID=153913 RepID=A0AA39TX93_9AGAR|nr:hypothetical protein EDD18DRAFT_1118395 [Armillaria luteobubalina]
MSFGRIGVLVKRGRVDEEEGIFAPEGGGGDGDVRPELGAVDRRDSAPGATDVTEDPGIARGVGDAESIGMQENLHEYFGRKSDITDLRSLESYCRALSFLLSLSLMRRISKSSSSWAS